MKGISIQLCSLIFLCLFSATPTYEANDNKTNTGCIQIEREALIKFKEGLSDPSNFLSTWIGDNCCSWKGISCSNKTGHVVKIELQNIQCYEDGEDFYGTNKNSSCLGGEMSPSLLDLKYLNHLDLSLNSFHIPIPEFLGSLGMLSYLNLSHSAFTGMIPQHLGNLSNLCYLDLTHSFSLYSNDLYWLSSLTSLEYLDMETVNLSLASTHWLQIINLLPSLSELHLASCELQNLPQSLSSVNFTSLSVLDLMDNSFDSPIPRWFFNLSTLVKLDLSLNEITGDISELIEDLSNSCNNSLEELILADNHISGHIPHSLGLLKKLKFLDLVVNYISGPIPASIGSLTNLEELSLSYNQMDGSLPESIKKLTKLTRLHLFQNNWQGNLSENQLQSLTKLGYFAISSSNKSFMLNISHNWVPPFSLRFIRISDCLLGPKFPAWLKTQKQLSSVILTNVGISEEISNWIWILSLRLMSCDFSNNQIRGGFPHSLEYPLDDLHLSSSNRSMGSYPSLNNMYYLNLAGNLLSGPIPVNIGQAMATLARLNLSGNFLSGPIPSSIGKMRLLFSLDLSNNKLSGKIQDNWRDLQALYTLDLSMNDLCGTIPGSILLLPRLSKLRLNANNLSGDLSTLKVNNRSLLTLLDLGENRFSGNVPKWLGECSILKELRLRANIFNGSIPEHLCDHVYLHTVDIAANNLSGAIPACLGNLRGFNRVLTYSPESPLLLVKDISEMDLIVKGRQMAYTSILELVNIMDFSSNMLSGEIPKEITRLSALGTLNLSRNQLTGNIPGEIGKLRRLETLDLSHNHLSGPIPQSMTSMTLLNYLNLSYNNLSGPIPSTNQFLTFNDPSIYEGNAELCGTPLPSKCHEPNTGNAEDQGNNTADNEDDIKFGFFISMVLGFVFGFWAVFGSLQIYEPWRPTLFHYVDNMKNWILLVFALKMARVRRRLRDLRPARDASTSQQ
ncbi:hypothetical protein ACH5RR_025159 [Cinchona calisaya]|uniref:Leucine-rich repeat-containing N-terminal plant-type domain-containing protein n=1 Tax=Cinchona calisaya TaxID=153742 RepID=A0ABD2YYU6_9GENT